MDTDLVIRAQNGDKAAYAVVATGIANRFLAVSRRILRDIDLAEDATQQALLAIWQDLPQLRDPARFEAWSYRLLVRACYAEGRKQRSCVNGTLIWIDGETYKGAKPAVGQEIQQIVNSIRFE